MKTIIATKTFSGATNEHGTHTRLYVQDAVYEVHESVANVFVAGDLARSHQEPQIEANPPTEAAPKKSGRKGKAFSPAKGAIRPLESSDAETDLQVALDAIQYPTN